MMHRGITKKKSPLNSTTPTGLVLNKRELRDFTAIAYENRNVEFLYLRENEFTDFQLSVQLPQLKVLDLSINNLTGPLTFMADTPRLRHLYLTGNRITSLEGFAELRELETLCLSDNDISTFQFFGEWPHLRVLSLNFNQIESFQHYGYLPQLRTLNLRGNPVAEKPSYRQMAIAASSPNLVSIDMEDIKPEERQAVDYYRGKVQFCIGEGMVVEGDQPEAQADTFLFNLNQANAPNAVLALHHISVSPVPMGSSVITEGEPIQLNVCLQDRRPYGERAKFHSQYIFPVAFQVNGEAKEVFLVGEMNKWGDPIPLERRQNENGEVLFDTTLYLPSGNYEYRYIVDGDEKLADGHVTSKYGQGQCNIYTVTEANKFEGEQTILYIRWTRSNENGGYDELEGENSLILVPKPEDIGFCYRAEVIAYLDGDFSFLYFDISSPVSAGLPSCPHISLEGNASEGGALTINAQYSGGTEGHSLLRWFRVTPEGDEVFLELEDPWAVGGYVCGLNDIGCRIKVEYTPVRIDNETGSAVTALSAPVTPGVASCRSLLISGELREGSLLIAEAEYTGGFEGNSRYQWYRLDEPSQQFVAIPGETSAHYTCSLADVRKVLAVDYTPISQQGVQGDTHRCTCKDPIAPGPPTVSDVRIRGPSVEEGMLTVEYTYSGGYAGMPKIEWFSEKPSKQQSAAPHRERIGRSNHATCTLTRTEVGSRIVVEVTPVRDDEQKGKPVSVSTDELVQAGEPQIRDLRVRPEVDPPVKGTLIDLEFTYFGGLGGEHEIVWEVAKGDADEWEIVARQTKKYVVTEANLGRMLRVSFTPVRNDGAKGETKIRLLPIPAPVQPEKEPTPKATEPKRAATPPSEPAPQAQAEPETAQPATTEAAPAQPTPRENAAETTEAAQPAQSEAAAKPAEAGDRTPRESAPATENRSTPRASEPTPESAAPADQPATSSPRQTSDQPVA
jgi:hypothetical protein